MLNVKIIAVGNLKDRFFTDAADEYIKRLGAYCRCEITEVKEAFLPNDPSDGEISAALSSEGVKIISLIPKKAYTVALCVEGKQMSSEKFAKDIIAYAQNNYPALCFIIGGSFGLSDEVKKRADFRLSFSEMTFPHRLMRVILLESLYRGFNICNGGKYHK